MRNPWTTKNPAMSMWLSAANRVAGSARGQATAAAKRQVATTQAEITRQIIDFWSGKSTLPVSRKKPRR
ncbi:MAG: hypothetical protein EOP82_31675 [Variovorax sp.]|nr:MAG: hypothetical protein EOP82_31675 [Variovorax sp.]